MAPTSPTGKPEATTGNDTVWHGNEVLGGIEIVCPRDWLKNMRNNKEMINNSLFIDEGFWQYF